MSFPSICYTIFTGTRQRTETKPVHRDCVRHSSHGLAEGRTGLRRHHGSVSKHTPAGGSSSIRVAAASPARRRATASAGRSRDVGKGLVCQRQERLGWGLPVWELAGGLLATHRSVRSTGTLLGIRTRCKGGEKWTRAAGRPGLKTATLSLSVDGSHRASVRHV